MELKNLELYNEDEKYYFRCDVRTEDKIGIYEIHFEKIEFPVSTNIEIEQIFGAYPWYRDVCTIDLLDGFKFNVKKDIDDNFFTINKIKDKTKEVTMGDIEKMYGCKVKIVNKEG